MGKELSCAQDSSIIHVLIPPTSWVSPDEQLSDFIVDPNQDGKRYSHKPVLEPERSEVQGCNVPKAVGENQSDSYLRKYPHPDDFVPEEALPENGIPPSFPDDQISHLLNGDADKEGRVASPLQIRALVLGPLLSVGILKVVDGIALPVHSDSQQRGREEPLLSIDGEIGDEGPHRLHDSDLQVGVHSQLLVHQPVFPLVPRSPVHDVTLSFLVGQCHRGDNVRAQVDEEDGDGADGHGDAGNDVDEEGAELSNVLGQGVGNGFL